MNNATFHSNVHVQFGKSRRGPGGGFWFGIALVVVGVGLLLDAFGLVEFGTVLSQWWPSILMFIAVAQLASGSGSVVGSAILFTIGALLQLGKLDYLPGGFWSAFWPIVLIIIGLSFISSRWKKKTIPISDKNDGEINSQTDRIDKSAVFGGVEMRVHSQNFSGGELSAIFGGIECDLRDAAIATSPQVLHVTAIFGGVELRVPREWNVIVKGSPVLGGIDTKGLANPLDPNAPTLLVESVVVLGGIEIRQ